MSTSKDDSGSFYHFTRMCQKIEAHSSHTEKTNIIKEYLEDEFKNADKYLLFKMLLIGLDKRVFHLKEKQLVNLFSQIFGFSKEKMFDHYQNDGDIGETLKTYLLKADDLAVKRSTYTLKQVDKFLDDLTEVTKQDEQVKLLEKFFCGKCTGDDIKYVTKLIIQDLKNYAGPKVVLSALHRDAYSAFNATHDLKSVIKAVMAHDDDSLTQLSQSMDMDAGSTTKVTKATDDDIDAFLKDTKFDKNSEDEKDDKQDSEPEEDEKPTKAKKEKKKKGKLVVDLKLNTPIKPMLARPCKTFDDAVKRCPNGFFAEIKYDGERIQIHKDGDDFKYYSRNLKDIMAHKLTGLQAYILKSTKAKSVVFDGELLMYDTVKQCPMEFVALSKSKKTNYANAVNAIFMFDILYLDGKSLLHVPLHKRRQLLEKVLVPQKNRIMLSDALVCKGTTEEVEAKLTTRMTEVITQKLEGLVLKDLETIYEPNARHWLKMKKDYLAGMADSADLVVLGGYFGSGSKGGLLSVYLMGCYDASSKTWKTVCKAGNGHDDKTIEKLDEHFRGLMFATKGDYSSVPSWLDCDRQHLPDFIMKNPQKSQVWEIAGAEFSESRKHTAGGYSIRFPRITKVRTDKDVDDATSLKQFLELVAESKKKGPANLTKKKKNKDDEEESDSGKKKGKRKRKADSDEEEEERPKKKRKKAAKKSDDDDMNDDEDDEEMRDFIVKDDDEEEEVQQKKPKAASASRSKPDDDVVEDDVDDTTDITEPIALNYVYGDFNKHIGRPAPRIYLHSVDDRGQWSDKGIMGLVTKEFGHGPQDEYENAFESETNNTVGCVQFTPVNPLGSNKDYANWVCNLIAQKKMKGKYGAPPIIYTAFSKGLEKVVEFVKEKGGDIVVNFSKFHHSVDNLDHKRVDRLLYKYFVKNNIDLYVFSKDNNDRGKTQRKDKNKQKPATPVVDDMVTDDDVAAPIVNDKPATTTSAKPSSPIDTPASKPVFENLRIVLSGIASVEQDAICKAITNNGGIVQSKWEMLGKNKSTHMVCESQNDMFAHVSNLGGKIVTKSWIFDSVAKNSLQDTDEYVYPPKKKAVPASNSNSQASTLQDLFTDCVFYLVEPVNDLKQVKRFLIAYDGVLAESENDAITHIISDADANTNPMLKYTTLPILTSKDIIRHVNEAKPLK